MSHLGSIPFGQYSHDLLLHDGEADLVDGTRAFVERGLSSGGQVLVHGTSAQVALVRAALGTHEQLEYALDADLYQSPTRTLFAYQRAMAQSREPIELWATGTVPLGSDESGHAAWLRYESAVNEVLRPYAFHGLCTYDAQTLPAATLAAARATHAGVATGTDVVASPEYQPPEDFLAHGGAGVPAAPTSPPGATGTLRNLEDLSPARLLLERTAVSSSAVPRSVIDDFVGAVDEVMTNALVHGRPPIDLEVWAEPLSLTCRVTDRGPGIGDPLSGYRYPERTGPRGLWAARQLCEGIYLSNQADGGCSVLLTTA